MRPRPHGTGRRPYRGPLLRAGLGLGTALGIALAADTASIAVMEIVDNAVMLAVPGAMEAGLTDPPSRGQPSGPASSGAWDGQHRATGASAPALHEGRQRGRGRTMTGPGWTSPAAPPAGTGRR